MKVFEVNVKQEGKFWIVVGKVHVVIIKCFTMGVLFSVLSVPYPVVQAQPR